MDFRFFLNDTEIDEPIGWSDIQLSMKRDETYHGMQFEASLTSLQFYGEAADLLMTERALNRVQANVIFRAEVSCENDTWEEVYRGRLNFGKFKRLCGKTCLVSIPPEEDSCRVIFKARFDQKVDIDATVAFDKITGLPTYTWLGQTIEIPAKALEVGTVGQVGAGSDAVNRLLSVSGIWMVRPTYEVVGDDSIDTGQLDPISNQQLFPADFEIPLTPQLLFEDQIDCFNGEFPYEIRNAGVINVQGPVALIVSSQLIQWDGEGTLTDDGTILETTEIIPLTVYPGDALINFDVTHSDTMAIPDGEGVYSVIRIDFETGGFDDKTFNITFNPNTSFSITARKLCPATDAQVYLIHETLSKTVEAVTNRCIRARSDYYGRIDSEPFAAPVDGCGGLRLLTSGLKLRQAPTDQAKFFPSCKDLMEGLNAVDNIGFSIDEDPDIAGKFIWRVEDVAYFYQNSELLFCDFVPIGEAEEQESGYYSRILIGYKKWEVEEVNGLGEPNSNREYRTSIDTINNTLDRTSAIVTGSYAIEITRQQSFAESGAADTSYDNDTFMICLVRDPYGFHVEQGNITGAANLFDPATILNYRLTPVRNLMRWAKSIFNSYANLGNTSSRLFFSSGTGNFIAEGMLDDETCRIESHVIAENQDIQTSDFAQAADYTPLWRPELITFEYPLSVAQYMTLKANPYGYISFQCGDGPVEQGFIQEINFQLVKGKATFILKRKW